MDKMLEEGYGKTDFDSLAATDLRDAAMGKGEEELFEKKMSKEERKAAAKAAREAKKKAKGPSKNGKKKTEAVQEEKKDDSAPILTDDTDDRKEEKREEALDRLSDMNINVTYEAKKGKLHANTRDINVSGVTVTFHGKPLIEETDLVINYGNRYGFIGPNGRYVKVARSGCCAQSRFLTVFTVGKVPS